MADLLHPDAELIELGRQFESAKAKARPLEKQKFRLYAEYERLARLAGLTDQVEDRKADGAIRRRCGYEGVAKAFTKAHSEAVRLMKAIHRKKATTLEGFAVKAEAIAFDQADFELDDPVPSDVAERMLYRLARDMAKMVKTSAKPKAGLGKLIDAFAMAKLAYDAAAEIDDNSDEWDAYEAAEHAIIVYPCQTIEDARLKARFFLNNDGPNDTLRNCFRGDHEWTLNVFLRSLIGEAQP